MDLGKYIEGICKDLDASVGHTLIHTGAQYEIDISADRAKAGRKAPDRH